MRSTKVCPVPGAVAVHNLRESGQSLSDAADPTAAAGVDGAIASTAEEAGENLAKGAITKAVPGLGIASVS